MFDNQREVIRFVHLQFLQQYVIKQTPALVCLLCGGEAVGYDSRRKDCKHFTSIGNLWLTCFQSVFKTILLVFLRQKTFSFVTFPVIDLLIVLFMLLSFLCVFKIDLFLNV